MNFPTPGALARRWLPVLVAGLLLSAHTAHAQSNQFWKPGTTPATWDNVSQNWWGDSAFTVGPQVWAAGNVANFGGSTAATVTLGDNIAASQLNFNTTGYTINGASNFTLNLTGATPTIDLGSGTVTTFLGTINANFSVANPLNIADTLGGSAAVTNTLQLLGTNTLPSTLTLTGNTVNRGSKNIDAFSVLASGAQSFNTINFTNTRPNSTYLADGSSTLSNGAVSTYNLGTLRMTGATPTITFGDPSQAPNGNTTGNTASSFVYENVTSTNLLHLTAESAGSGANGWGLTAINFFGTNNNFSGGMVLDSTGSSGFDTTTDHSGDGRFNFNTPTAAGVGANAGTIYVKGNGLVVTDSGGLVANSYTIPNNIVLNSADYFGNGMAIDPTTGRQFITAIGATKASSGLGKIVYTGVISGPGSVIIGNDLTRASGGAGLTLFANQMTYTGKTIYNGTYNTSTTSINVFQMGTTNALPTNNVLQYGYSDNETTASGLQTKTLGTVDLNGYNTTIASLVSSIREDVSINGITDSDNAHALPGQVAVPTLTINGATNDWYTGGLGSALNFGASYPTLHNSYNTVALTRTGLGSTTLGATWSVLNSSTVNGANNGNRSDYLGPTNINGSASLIAGAVTAFSPNSNFNVAGDTSFGGSGIATLDLNGYSNTVNSLAGTANGVVTNNVNQVDFNGEAAMTTTSANGGMGSNAVLTIGVSSNTATNATFAGVIKDGTSGTLGITMAGSGVQTLTGVNTYTGPTNINLGTLRIGSTGSLAAGSSVSVNANGTLAGFGTVNGPVSVNSSGAIAPGSVTTAGALTVGSLDLFGGGIYKWKVTDAAGVAGTGYDTITSPGSLTFDGSVSASSPVSLKLSTLGVTPQNFTNNATHTWTLASFANPIGGFAANDFSIDATGFQGGNLFSTFGISLSGDSKSLLLTYTPGTAPAVLTWTNGGTGGIGNWSPTGGAQWTTSGSMTTSWNSASSADFTGTSGIVTIIGNIQSPLLTFDVDGYTVAASGNNSLSATAGYTSLTVQVTNAGQTGTISAPITAPLTLIGNGTLVLSSTGNTFNGGTITVSGGVLEGSSQTLGGTNGNTPITNNTTVIFNQTTAGTYSGVIGGSGNVIKTGAGALTLGGANTFNGGLTISQGSVRVQNGDSNLGNAGGTIRFDGGTLDTSPVTFGISSVRPVSVTANGGTINDAGFGSTNAFSGGATVAGGATFNKTGIGTLQILNNAWTGSGTINIQNGTLLLGDPTNANSSASNILGGNAITLNNNTSLIIASSTDGGASLNPSQVTLNGNVTLYVHKTAGAGGIGSLNPSLNGPVAISGGTIRISGNDPLGSNSLSGPSTYTIGDTTISGDTTFQTESNVAQGYSTSLTMGAYTDNGHTTTFLGQGNNSIPQAPGNGVFIDGSNTTAVNPPATITGQWIIGDAAGMNAQIVQENAALVANPQLAFTTGNVTINPGSALVFAPKNAHGATAYGPSSGTQTINVFSTGPLGSKGASQGGLELIGSAQAEFNSNVTFNLGNASNQALFDLASGSETQQTLLTIDGPVVGAGLLQLHSGNTAKMTIKSATPNTLWTGGTAVLGGELDVASTASIGSGDLTMAARSSGSGVASSTTLVFNNAVQSVGNLSDAFDGSSAPLSQSITLNGTNLIVTQTVAATYGDPNGNNGFSATGSRGFILGTGGLTLSSSSTAELTLYDSDSDLTNPSFQFTGPVTINGGSLAINQDNDLGAVPAVSTVGQLTLNGGNLHTTAGIALAATRGFSVGSARTSSIQTDGNQLTINGQTSFAANGNLTITAGSHVTLAPSTHAFSVGSGATVTVAPSASLELAGSDPSLGDGSGSGAPGHVANIVNNGAVASGGELLIDGTGAQQVGFVSGAGDTFVGANTNLVIDGIRQNTLNIGSGAIVTIDPTDASGMPLAAISDDATSSSSGSRLAALLAVRHVGASTSGSSSGVASSAATGTLSGALSVGGSVSAVPEPSTLAMGALAVAGMFGYLRLRGKNTRSRS